MPLSAGFYPDFNHEPGIGFAIKGDSTRQELSRNGSHLE